VSTKVSLTYLYQIQVSYPKGGVKHESKTCKSLPAVERHSCMHKLPAGASSLR